MAEIAQDCQMSAANLYRYFDNKQDIGAAISQLCLADKIDVLITGIGTGGTLMGISRRLKEKHPNIKVIGVEPPPGDNIQGLKCLGEKLPPFWDSSLIDEKTNISSKVAEMATLSVLDKDGIFAGQSSGAVIAQAIKTSYDIEEGNIVVVLADGGWKYLSMDFWTKGS